MLLIKGCKINAIYVITVTQFGYKYIYLHSDRELMNIHNKSSLIDFWLKHADSKKELELWFNDVSERTWHTPHDIKNNYTDASIIGNSRVVFNICYNDYRLIVQFNYKKGWAFIKFIGTHKEYMKVDAETVNWFPKQKNK